MSNANKSYYQQMLKTNICEVVFTKADGSERTMKCSLLPSVFTQFNLSESTKSTKKTSDEQLNVIDVDKGDWRSFKIAAVKSFKVVSASFTNMLANTLWITKQPKSQYAGFQASPSQPEFDVVEKYQIPPHKLQFYLDQLRSHICNITFEKANGEIREMNATLSVTYLKDHNLAPNVPTTPPLFDNDTIRVVDTDINEWRTFKISKLISFKTPFIEKFATQPVVLQPRPVVIRETTLTTVA
ncbi:MAG: hypothetical protein CTY12_06285 [Methylotenera sp.]|nr:MAG: hypothetical protein CTY12_06285 [Methylotenera sp.]